MDTLLFRFHTHTIWTELSSNLQIIFYVYLYSYLLKHAALWFIIYSLCSTTTTAAAAATTTTTKNSCFCLVCVCVCLRVGVLVSNHRLWFHKRTSYLPTDVSPRKLAPFLFIILVRFLFWLSCSAHCCSSCLWQMSQRGKGKQQQEQQHQHHHQHHHHHHHHHQQ